MKHDIICNLTTILNGKYTIWDNPETRPVISKGDCICFREVSPGKASATVVVTPPSVCPKCWGHDKLHSDICYHVLHCDPFNPTVCIVDIDTVLEDL